jgi:large subunit ribosomal protein L10
MAQQWKVDKIHKLKEELQRHTKFLFTDYRGMNVQQINGLRNTLREKGTEFHVLKNRFLKRVFVDLGVESLDRILVNPTAVAYSIEDMSEVAKILIDESKESTLQIKGGYLDGSVLSFEDIESLSRLPSRQVLIAQAVGMLNAPMNSLVFVLGGLISKFVRTLKAIEVTKK